MRPETGPLIGLRCGCGQARSGSARDRIGAVVSDGGPTSDLRLAWVRFLGERGVDAESLLAALPGHADRGADVRALITTYVDEGPVAVELVAPHIRRGMRILEVGSGIGLVSRFLATLGHDVVATEPSSDGFPLMRDAEEAVDRACGPVEGPGSLSRLGLGVDDLDPDALGRFDLVFSSNVLEHLPDPGRALVHLHRFVADGGIQTHVCPNYAFPFDPHISRPLLPLAPHMTRIVLPRRLREDPAFRTVNFVTAGRLRRAARAAGLELEFDRGLLAAAFDRFATDPTFAARHAGLGPIVRIMRATGVDRLVRAVPPSLASPMRFTVRGPARA